MFCYTVYQLPTPVPVIRVCMVRAPTSTMKLTTSALVLLVSRARTAPTVRLHNAHHMHIITQAAHHMHIITQAAHYIMRTSRLYLLFALLQ